MVTWDSMVVGHLLPGSQYNALSLAEGETSTTEENFALVNCWDGEPLPGGEYELLVTQMFSAQEPEVIVPDAPVEDEPIVDTPSPEPGSEDVVDGETLPSPRGDQDIALAPSSEFFVVAEPLPLLVEGDVPDDPFAEYLAGAPEPIELPDNYLTPDIARELYQASVEDGVWNMAPGTQRWVMQNSADQQFDDQAWERNYFGCSWDGNTARTFPTQSADMGLLAVDGTLPSVLNLSYGWIVDGNPLMSLSVTNTSEYAIPGFYGQPSAQLYLVRDGRVVAESYGVNTDREAEFGIWEDGADWNAAQQLGLLEPGQALGGEYLWRDVTGCWTDTAGPETVDTGTYTVLTAQYVHVSSGDEYMYYGDDMAAYDDVMYGDGSASEGGVSTFSEGMDIRPSADSMPYPGGDYDWVELVVWTSLGEVTLAD